MAQLNDLLEKDVKDLSVDELEMRHHLLKKLRVAPAKKSSGGKRAPSKSNKDKRLEDAVNKMSPEEREKLKQMLGL